MAAQLRQHFFTSPEPNLSRWWTGQWLAVEKNMGNYFLLSLPGGLNRHTDSTRRSNLLGNTYHTGLFDINYFLQLCKKSIIILLYTWENGLTQQAQGRVSLSNAIFTTEILERVTAILEAVYLQHRTFFLFVCLFLLLLLWPWHVACWILAPWPGIEFQGHGSESAES